MKIFWIKETLKIIHFNVEIIYLQKNIVNYNGISNVYCVSNKLKFKLMDSWKCMVDPMHGFGN